MNSLHQTGDFVNNRYRILEVLGQGGMGTTYKAEDILTGELVALKMLSIRYLKHTKVVELFEREARILSQLDHPGIPQYVDYFQTQQSRYRRFYIAQQLAEGQSLAALVEQGWKPDETEVRLIATQLLEILVYLQQLTPPVLHRDIKPQNIIRSATGQLFLVDFGAVQTIYHQTQTGGSTLIGTYGYMPPEQYARQATLATDLYGLGKTLIFLLTQTHPANLPPNNLMAEFAATNQLSQSFTQWMDCLIEPALSDRFFDAAEAVVALQGADLNSFQSRKRKQPFSSRVQLIHSEECLLIKIPAFGLNTQSVSCFASVIGLGLIVQFVLAELYDVIVNSFLTVDQSLYSRLLEASLSRLSSTTSWSDFLFATWILMIGILMCRFFLSVFFQTRLAITSHDFSLERLLFNDCFHSFQGKTADLQQVEVRKWGASLRRFSVPVCILKTQTREYRFGSFLTYSEKVWLVSEINKFLFHNKSFSYQNSTEFPNTLKG